MVPIEIVEKFFAAIEAGDRAATERLLHDDALVDANIFPHPHDRGTTLTILAWLQANVRDLHYDIVRRFEIAGGCVQEHVLRGIAPDGSEIAAAACMVIDIADDRITRINEYLDSAQVRALMP